MFPAMRHGRTKIIQAKIENGSESHPYLGGRPAAMRPAYFPFAAGLEAATAGFLTLAAAFLFFCEAAF